ncbi:MAG: O-antigen ligase family protein [Nitrospirota bacterium]
MRGYLRDVRPTVAIVGAALLAAACDTGRQSLLFTALTAWAILGLLLIVGMRPATAVMAVAGRSIDLSLLALLALGALSAFWWTADPGGSDLGLIKLGSVVVLALALPRLLRSPADYRPLLLWIALLAGNVALYGFVQLAMGWNVMGGRLHSVFLTPNSLAGFLAATLPLTVGLGLTARAPVMRSGAILLAALQAAALLATASRGGWLAAAIGFMAFVLMAGRRGIARWRAIVLPAAMGVVLVIAVIAAIDRFDPSLIRPRLASMSHLLTAEPQRYLVWQSTVDMIAERPIAGWGLGAFAVAYLPFKSPSFEGVTQYYAHNDYLQIGAELGLAGLALFGWLLGAAASTALGALRRSGERAREGSSDEHVIVAAVIGGGSAVLLHSLVDFDLYVPVIMLTLAVYLGYLRAWFPSAAPASADSSDSPLTHSLARSFAWTVCCVVVALLVGRIYLASRADVAGQQLMQEGRYEEAASHFTGAIRWNPYPAAYYGNLGFAYEHWANQARRQDLLLKAEAAFRAATEAGPYDYRPFLNLGKFYKNYAKFSNIFNDFDPWSAYRRAAELHPTRPSIRQELEALEVSRPEEQKPLENTSLSA